MRRCEGKKKGMRLKVRNLLSRHFIPAGDAPPANGYTSLSDAYYKAGPAAGVGAGGGLGASGSGEAWVEVGRGRAFTPGPEDVGSALRLEVACIDGSAGTTYGGGGVEVGRPVAVATARVRPAPAPPRRALVCLDTPTSAPLAPGSVPGRFTVLTYNTLADLYAQPDAHPASPPWALAWAYRRQNLLKELLAAAPDVLCLQEVQSNHYSEWWAPELHRAGYTGVYKKKTGALYTGGAAFAADGCATFFKRGRFALVKKYEVEFNKAALSLADGLPAATRGAALTRLLKDNVALIAVLEALDTAAPAQPSSATSATPPRRQLVCVANTHIHANPELNDVKLWQVHTLLKGLEKIAASADVPMVLAGDFNSTPGSAAHRLLTTGRVDDGHPDLEGDPLGILKPSSKLAHGLPLASAYAAALGLPRGGEGGEPAPSLTAPGPAGAAARLVAGVDRSTGEPVLTNVGRDFRGTLDYILYAADALVPTALLELPVFEGVGGSVVGGGGGSAASPRAATGATPASRPPLPPGAPAPPGGLAAPPVVGASGLPSERWSSDHVALMAEFTYRR
jgi:CCR4-NOT transcription complex subunit 6